MGIIQPPKFSGKNAKPFDIVLSTFRKGTITLLDVGRIPVDGVAISQNMMLDQDGVWRTRYGSFGYGKTLTGPIDGVGRATYYQSSGANINYLFVIDNGALKYCTDGGNWSTVTGFTWTTGYSATLLQVQNRLYVCNAKDNLAYADITNLGAGVTSYSALATPGTVTLTPTASLTSGTRSYSVYYKITAVKNTIGETAASAEATTTINKIRDNWVNGTDSVALSWSAVTGADSYNIYYSDQTGQEIFIDATSALAYTDQGQTTPNPFQAAPSTDGTAGPPFAVIRWSGNRMWFTGNPAFPYRVYFSGTGLNLTSLNPFYGAGYVDLNLGSDEKIMDIQNFRDGRGNQIATVLTSSPTGGGSVWFVTLSSLSAGSLAITVPASTSQGTIGTTSSRGAVQANNNIYYPSIKGFQSIGSAPNIINVIVTTDISAIVRPTVQGISASAANLICGVYFYGRIYWSVPWGSTTNNQIWILDLERQAWTLPWTLAVKQFLEYTDSAGVVHLLGIPVTGTQLIEISAAYQGDSGVAFNSNLQSGLIFFDKSHFTWAWVQKFYVEFGRPRGVITFTLSGTQPNKNLTSVKTITITDTTSSSGLGEDYLGDFQLGQSNSAPSAFSQASIKKVLYINKKLNNLQWQISSTDINQNYSLLSMGIVGNLLPQTDPSSWRK